MSVSWTAVTAVVGAVLGVWNLVQSHWQRRGRLKVIPKLTAIRAGVFLSSEEDLLRDGFSCVAVTNLSAFAVTIAEIGFTVAGGDGRLVIIPEPRSLLPKRLEARESADFHASQVAGFPKTAKLAYAKTQCRHTRYGDSTVLKKWRKLSGV
jgi:hypothetical protein